MLEASLPPLTIAPVRIGKRMAKPNPTTEIRKARVWSRVNVSGPDECWLWNGPIGHEGYGYVSWAGRNHTSHRAVWESVFGPAAQGMEVDHLCRNRACCNPKHLELVEKAVNVLRGVSPPALNARKTHCPIGHPLEGSNLIVGNRSGKVFRQCRLCNNESHVRMRARQKAALHEPTPPTGAER